MAYGMGITSKWKAYPPGSGESQLVEVSHDRKKRLEEKGWRFERPGQSDFAATR